MAQFEDKKMQSSSQFKFDNSAYSNNKYKDINNDDVPDSVKYRFNWGAFFFNFVWGLFNKTYITLIIIPIAFIPVVNAIVVPIVSVWFGIKGNEWAWKNKEFDSEEDFHSSQQTWAFWGTFLTVITLVLAIIWLILAPVMLRKAMLSHSGVTKQAVEQTYDNQRDTSYQGINPQVNNPDGTETVQVDNSVSESEKLAIRAKISKNLTDAWVMNQTMSEECVPTSVGLAKYFSKRLAGKLENNSILTYDGVNYVFTGDGSCEKREICKVTVTFNYSGRQDSANIPVYKNSYGYIHIDSKDMNDYRNNTVIVVEPPKPVQQEEINQNKEDNTKETETENN